MDSPIFADYGAPSALDNLSLQLTRGVAPGYYISRLQREGKVRIVVTTTALQAFKNQFEYYVDQDWNLPIGYLYFNTPADQNMPPLVVSMWFRGELDNTKLAAYLFYNGKQIASTKDQSGSAGYDSAIFANAHEGNTRWERWKFSWGSVRGWNTDTSSANNTSDIFFMNQRAGEYDVKVLREGDLARSAKLQSVPMDGSPTTVSL
jgi:hypothetical protein